MTTTIKVNLTKTDCGWCPLEGTLARWAIDTPNWIYYACTYHARNLWPALMPLPGPAVKVGDRVTITRSVPDIPAPALTYTGIVMRLTDLCLTLDDGGNFSRDSDVLAERYNTVQTITVHCLWCDAPIGDADKRVPVPITDTDSRDAHASCNDDAWARARAIVRGAH